MIRFNGKKICGLVSYLLIVFITNAQPGCPAVSAGNDVSLPCGSSCTTLKATPFDAGSTAAYSVSQIPYTPFSYTGGTTVLANIDDIWSPVVTLPFNFCFFDSVYTQVLIGSNSEISFNIGNLNSPVYPFNPNYNPWSISGPIPRGITDDTTETKNSIMAPWEDIDPTNQGTISYQIIGTAPCRIFVASWSQCGYYGDPNSVCASCDTTVPLLATSQVALYETTNVIEIYIQQKQQLDGWNNGWAIEGIENSTGTTAYTVPGRNATNWNAANDAWRFTPTGPSIVSVSWYKGATQISTDSVVQVCPSAASTTYTAKAVYTPCSGGTPVTVTDNVTVTLAGSLLAGIDSFKNVSCPGRNDGKAYAAAVSANPPVSYGWSNGSTSLTLTNLSAGTYIFTATDAASCMRTDTVIITEPTALIANVPNVSVTNCSGTGTGGLTVQTTGGNNPYTYLWTNGQTGATDTALSSGTYIVTVTDQNACTVTASGTFSTTVGGNTLVLNAPAITNVSCFGLTDGSITANPSGGTNPYQYAWSNAQNSATINNLAPGPYTVSVSDAGGCTVTATYNINQPNVLAINPAYIVNDLCGATAAGEIIAEVSGGRPVYTYSWTEASNGQSLTGDTISNLAPDNYTLTVTDASNCTASATYQVTQTPGVVISVDSVNVTCFGGNDGSAAVHVLGGTPPILFSWDQSPLSPSDSTIGTLSMGPVDIYVIDSNNCIADRLIYITQPTQVTVGLVSVKNVSCNGGSDGTITVSGSGGSPGYTFNWNDGVAGATDTALASGSYFVTATDITGCTGNGTFNVTQPTALSVDPADIQNIGCAGGNTGSITANISQGTPAYTYSWTQQPGGQTYGGQTISNLAVGSYTMTVTDALGCKDSGSYSITAIPLLRYNVSATPVSCYAGNNGSARVAITSGTPPYLFSWNNSAPATDSATGNLTAGFLLVEVTDANNCTTDTTISVAQPLQPIIITLVNAPTNVLCNGGNNGELDVVATGGTPGYTYTWSNQFIGTNNTHLTAGPYTLIVVDNNDCADTTSYLITQPTPVTANPIAVNALCYRGRGTIDANPSGGVPGYSFLWSTGETTRIADTLVRGSYDCTITDANGCQLIITDTVGQPAQMLLTLDSAVAVLCVGQQNGKVIVAATGDTPPYIYNATKDLVNFVSGTNGVISGLDTGIYIIQVFDSVGCSAEFFTYIPPAIPDEFFAPVVDSTLCYGPEYNDGAVLVLDSTIQNGPYRYGIDGGVLQDSGYFQNLSAGAHEVTAVSHNGCVSSIPVFVPEPLPVVAIVTPDTVVLPLEGSQTVLVTYLNATNPSYNWSPSLGLSCIDCPNPVVNAYTPSNYVVTVSMVNGTATCYGSTTLYVEVLSHTKAFVPNAFSPNGDGNNDLFQIYGEDIKTLNLKVFNRWGELVYTTTNSLAGWDGTYKGVLQMPGVFTYETTITYLDDSQESRKGTVTLIR